MEYVITVDNSGPGTSYGTNVSDILDESMIFAGASQSGFDTSDPGFSFSTPAASADCAVVTCVVEIASAKIAPGGQGVITIRTILK